MRPNRFPWWCAALLALALARPAPAQPVLIGLDANPPPTAGFSAASKRAWFNKAVTAGISQVSIAPKWNDLEKTPGRYDFGDLDFQGQLAREHGLPVYLNIRIVDTNNRALPEPYARWTFDDPRLQTRLVALIQALAPRLRGQVRWVSIGNEVDSYFSAHRDEVAAYRRLLDGVIGAVRTAFPGALFTVNFTFGGLGRLDSELRPISEMAEFTSLTYYPMNPDFTFRDPGDVSGDFSRMFAAAHGQKVFFQEIGYASSDQVGSSSEKQARFIHNVLLALEQHRGQTIAAHFVWMSDIPLSLVDTFGSYYKLPNSGRFKAFLGSLGYFDRDGRPKPAWTVLEREAGALSRPDAPPKR